MRFHGIILPPLALWVGVVAHSLGESNYHAVSTTPLEFSASPTETYPLTQRAASNGDNGEPNEDDIAWVDSFMAGEHLDSNLHFDPQDFVEAKDDDRYSVSYADEESSGDTNKTITALTLESTRNALVHAHKRARNAVAKRLAARAPEDEDFVWVDKFLNGDDVDEQMIFDLDDLTEPSPDEKNILDGTLAPTLGVLDKRILGDKRRIRHRKAALRRAKRGLRRARRRRKIHNVIPKIVPGPWSDDQHGSKGQPHGKTGKQHKHNGNGKGRFHKYPPGGKGGQHEHKKNGPSKPRNPWSYFPKRVKQGKTYKGKKPLFDNQPWKGWCPGCATVQGE